MRAYERLGRDILRATVYILPAGAIGCLVKFCVLDKSLSSEFLWIGLLVCVSLLVQGRFLDYLSRDLRDLIQTLRKEQPSLCLSPEVFYQCRNLELAGTPYYQENIKYVPVRCRLRLMTASGCPSSCHYYQTSRPTGAGTGGGALIGGLAGAVGGPLGAVIGAIAGGAIGTLAEANRVKSLPQKEVEDAQRRGIRYRIVIDLSSLGR